MTLSRTVAAFGWLVLVVGCGEGVDNAAPASGPQGTTTAPQVADPTTTTSEPPVLPGYTALNQDAFMDNCALGGGDFTVCECVYDELSRAMPFDRFAKIDRFLTSNPSSDLPDDLLDVFRDCIESESTRLS